MAEEYTLEMFSLLGFPANIGSEEIFPKSPKKEEEEEFLRILTKEEYEALVVIEEGLSNITVGNVLLTCSSSEEDIMPAATTTIAPEPPQAQLWYRPTGDKVMEPFSSAITAAEHKIRNLEKRKLKLDQYRSEQAQGRTLNADQLGAVAKYSEVIQQLENNREIVTCLKQVHQHTIKFIKHEMKRDNLERNKYILSLQAVLDQLQHPTVQHDVLTGDHGAPKIPKESLVDLTELSKALKPSLGEPDFAAKLEAGADTISKLFESRGKINNKSSHEVKTLIDSLAESQYFKSGPVVSTVSVPIDCLKEETTLQQPTVNPNPNPVNVLPESPITMSNNNPVSAQLLMKQDREMAFSFMQESQLEIESPHMDPAVVAVSAFVPPPPQIQSQTDNNHVYPPAPPPTTESLNNIQPGMQNLNINNVNNSNNLGGGGDADDHQWESMPESGNFTNNSNGNGDGDQDNINGVDRGSRNNFRGRGNNGRGHNGRGNGYPRGSRGNGNGTFNNHRGNGGQYFRADRGGQLDGGNETAEYSQPQQKSLRGYSGPRPYRGGGNVVAGANGPPPRPLPYNARRGRGNPRGAPKFGYNSNNGIANEPRRGME